MGKGDKKSRKGKIFRGSYGVARPRKSNIAILPAKKEESKKKSVVKKKKAKKK
jgi:30S ribosomal protein S31